ATTEVLLEAAYFERMAIAHTSKRLGLRTEASARFERGTDPEGLERAAARFAELTGLSASGSALSRAIVGDAPPRRQISLRTARVNHVLGTALEDSEIGRYLAPIGFDATLVESGCHEVVVPSFRPDAEQEIDLIE